MKKLSPSLPTCMVVPVVHLTMTSRCLLATTSFKAEMEANKSKTAWHWRLPVIVDGCIPVRFNLRQYLLFILVSHAIPWMAKKKLTLWLNTTAQVLSQVLVKTHGGRLERRRIELLIMFM